MGKSQSKEPTVFVDTTVITINTQEDGWCVVDFDTDDKPKTAYRLNGTFNTNRLVLTNARFNKALQRKRASEFYGRLERSALVGLIPIRALIATEALISVLVTQWSLDRATSRASYYLWYSLFEEIARGENGDALVANYLSFERRAETNFPVRVLFWITNRGRSVARAKKLAQKEFIEDLLKFHDMVTVVNANHNDLVHGRTCEARNFYRLVKQIEEDPEKLRVLVEDPLLAKICRDTAEERMLHCDSFRYDGATDFDADVETKDDRGLDKWNKSLDIVPCMRTDSEKFVQRLIKFVNTPENDGALVRSKGSRHVTWDPTIDHISLLKGDSDSFNDSLRKLDIEDDLLEDIPILIGDV